MTLPKPCKHREAPVVGNDRVVREVRIEDSSPTAKERGGDVSFGEDSDSEDSTDGSESNGGDSDDDTEGIDDRVVSRFWGNRDDSNSSSFSSDDDNDDDDDDDDDNDKRVDQDLSWDDPIESNDSHRNCNRRSLDPDYAWEQIEESQVFLPPPVKTISLPATSLESEESTTTNQASSEPTAGKSDGTRDFVRLVFISDTHGKHREISHLPRGDVLVHAGDFTKSGETGSMEDLAAYFRQALDETGFSEVVCVAGNHDLTLDRDYYDRNWERFHRTQSKRFDPSVAEAAVRRHSVYLRDESHWIRLPCGQREETAAGDHSARRKPGRLQVWGSPYSPEFFDWAFNKKRGLPIREIWNQIPSEHAPTSTKPSQTNGHTKDVIEDPNSQQNHLHPSVDVLITHGPPLGRGDLVYLEGGARRKRPQHTTRAGCYDLLQVVQDRVKPRVHVFGHIHEGYGVTYDGTTLFLNASSMNLRYEAVHLPIVVDLPIFTEDSGIEVSAWLVRPSSLFRNAKTHIDSVPEWIEWCQSHGHSAVAEDLQNKLPRIQTWFRATEPSPDEFFDSLVEILGYYPSQREARRNLSAMVFQLYADSFETS